MAAAREIVRKLIEADADNPDSPEAFDIYGHLQSPVARLAITYGFQRDDRFESEERYVKLLSNGQEAWLRTVPHSPEHKPMDFQRGTGGREWEFLVVKPEIKCAHCNKKRPARKGLCPHCKRSGEINKYNEYDRLAQSNEVGMYYLLSAIIQRLSTWPEDVPRPQLEARKPKPTPVPAPPLTSPDDPAAIFKHYTSAEIPLSPYATLLRHMREDDLYVTGKVTRDDHHYVHERTTNFELNVSDAPREYEPEINAAIAKVQALIDEEIVNINKKIYKALNREWDYRNSDDTVDDELVNNDYVFTRDGHITNGRGVKFEKLKPEAKEAAREWHRQGNAEDNFWSEHIIEEWQTELEEMGFSNVEIAYSGFWSQGDGASFTADSFNLEKWTKWFFSDKPKEKGHPYTDDLNEALDPADDPAMILRHTRARKGCPYCGCPDFNLGTGFVTPRGTTIQNVYCAKCGGYYTQGEEKLRLEAVGPDDPNLFMQSLDTMPDHELVNTSVSDDSLAFNCVCGRWCYSGVARDDAERARFYQRAKEEFAKHNQRIGDEAGLDKPTVTDKLKSRNFITSLRARPKPTQEAYDFKIDDEFGCLTNAEKLVKAYPQLRYVEGWCRLPKGQWGAHAWAVNKSGQIVDPYFQCKFGDEQKTLQYREAEPDEDPFDRGYG